MKTKKFSHFVGIALAITVLFGAFNPVTALATEKSESSVSKYESVTNVDETPVSRAGAETLPLGTYRISDLFTVTDSNLTPVKTVAGRYLQLNFWWRVSPYDKGISGEIITIKIKDANTGQYITNLVATDTTDSNSLYKYCKCTFDLGYSWRRIQIFTDVSSSGASNGNFRSAEFSQYNSTVYN